jgi:hypothetical protein
VRHFNSTNEQLLNIVLLSRLADNLHSLPEHIGRASRVEFHRQFYRHPAPAMQQSLNQLTAPAPGPPQNVVLPVPLLECPEYQRRHRRLTGELSRSDEEEERLRRLELSNSQRTRV